VRVVAGGFRWVGSNWLVAASRGDCGSLGVGGVCVVIQCVDSIPFVVVNVRSGFGSFCLSCVFVMCPVSLLVY
jgi:hypothetical protein